MHVYMLFKIQSLDLCCHTVLSYYVFVMPEYLMQGYGEDVKIQILHPTDSGIYSVCKSYDFLKF